VKKLSVILLLLVFVISGCSKQSEFDKKVRNKNLNEKLFKTEIFNYELLASYISLYEGDDGEYGSVKQYVKGKKYIVEERGIKLTFSTHGYLVKVYTNSWNNSLSDILFVGDSSTKLKSQFGKPTSIIKVKAGVLFLYQKGDRTYKFLVKDKVIRSIEYSTTSDTALLKDEHNIIEQNFNPDSFVDNESSNTEAVDNTAVETKNNTSTSNVLTRDQAYKPGDLYGLLGEVIDAWVYFAQTTSLYDEIPHNEQLTMLEARFNSNGFWDKGLKLEQSKPYISGEYADLYYFLVEYMDAVDLSYSYKITALNNELGLIKNASPSEAEKWTEMAEDKQARSNELYEAGKGVIFP
jgi:hypothetical protein